MNSEVFLGILLLLCAYRFGMFDSMRECAEFSLFMAILLAPLVVIFGGALLICAGLFGA